MSLDSLYRQILLSEHHLSERAQKLKDVKAAIARSNERINNERANYQQTKEQLELKAQQSSTMRLQCDLMKKSEEQMLKQIEELLCQKNHLREHLDKIRKTSKEEEEMFRQEISRFNSDFSLQRSRAPGPENQLESDLLRLDQEVEALHKEMELMRCSHSNTRSSDEEMRRLLLELQGVDYTQKAVDQQLEEARTTTESLRSELQSASHKHLTDSTCLRLRKELEMLKDENLEHQRGSLRSQIEFLQSKLNNQQENQQR
nr:coiled-coil domain-containing protein 172 [Nothobranchius furzeri]